MGAVGAILMAVARRRLSLDLLRQAMDDAVLLRGVHPGGLHRVRPDLSRRQWRSMGRASADGLPGGQWGFLIVVSILTFVLAFFLDFFELAFIIVPLLGPVADKLGIDLIWFGVILAVNMQTSFMHPPFGFALFYLRSVAPRTLRTG